MSRERPEAMEEASVMMVGLKKDRILQGLEVLETQEKDTLRLGQIIVCQMYLIR